MRDAIDAEESCLACDGLEAAHGAQSKIHDPPSPKTPPKRERSPSHDVPESQSYRNRKRAAKRRQKVEQFGHAASERTVFEHVQLADPINSSLKLSSLPVDASGYSALRLKEDPGQKERDYSLSELLGLGFRYVEWDGRWGFSQLKP